mgnify:FL=1
MTEERIEDAVIVEEESKVNVTMTKEEELQQKIE